MYEVKRSPNETALRDVYLTWKVYYQFVTFSLFTKFWKLTRIEDWICVLLIDHAMSWLWL